MEVWDIYDKNRNKTNKTHVRGTPLAVGDYHIVVHVWIRNKKDDILLTKRHPDKPHPNLWECSGGSILAGENSLDGAVREVKEEIGINLSRSNGKLIKSERRDVYNDFYDVWLFNQSFEITETILQKDEVSDIKWVTKSELESMYNSNCIVPTLSYFKLIF
ncbi:DNA mismatch repair protein MutT [Bacillus sp. AFS018417]|uniref:NUDIX hydrolase n=1 Tax=unclassified Bacillus (in: firmicutes) TaxID=185979 RepID=UPI000BFA3FBF|nr:NUDIX domain-containing protein [Bacillus sp. AFS018417]PEZ08178.1 DNA mismatch repair protein MutT [Bacillus sp. AFS018417]